MQDTEKAYIALFTCAASRAVHLEMVTDLKTETFLLCFTRFVSRRGLPVLVVTDNSKTFKAFSKPLQATMKSSVVLSYLAERGIKWKFNLSKAPWWGGFYERLIKGVKTCLKISIGRASLSYDKLHTIIVEMEGILNSRPLKYQYPEDLEQPLTPSHLLTGRRPLQLAMQSCEHKDQDFEETHDTFWKRATNITRVLEQWWKRWKREYLLNLRKQHFLNRNPYPSDVIKTGDIVMIQNENNKKRIFWKMGCVEELLKGADNVVRGDTLQLANQNIIQRPIEKLYSFEVSCEISQVVNGPRDEEPIPAWSRRKAAALAKEKLTNT